MKLLLTGLLLAALPMGCSATASGDDGLIYPSADSIRVTRAPNADFDAASVGTVEISDDAAVRKWRETLDEIPEVPPHGIRLISFLPETVEYRIEFLGPGGEILGTHRMKGANLAVAREPSWAFYSGEDREFVELVEQLFAGS